MKFSKTVPFTLRTNLANKDSMVALTILVDATIFPSSFKRQKH